jgi:uncharacterized membrane protein YuzA (DUF378 family)
MKKNLLLCIVYILYGMCGLYNVLSQFDNTTVSYFFVIDLIFILLR